MNSPWHAALVWPDPDWGDAGSRLFGLGRLERLLLTLSSSGIGEVVLPRAGAEVREALGRSRRRDRLPAVVPAAAGPLLVVRSGALFDLRLLPWFAARLDEHARGVLYACDGEARPLMFSVASAGDLPGGKDFEAAAREAGGPRLTPPHGHVCVIVPPAGAHGPDGRGLWRLTSKPAERWHLRHVRRWLFPLTALLAERGVHPNTVTRVSFWVAVVGCILLAFGGYAGGVLGALVLYAAWVLDCLDGALSRLTFQASAAGAKLDTDLGRAAYALTAAALGWAIYGSRGDWKQASVAALAFALGGYLSIVAGLRADRLPVAARPPGLWRFRTSLDHLLHRDNTLILLACAAAGRPSLFLWLLIALLHLSWVADTAVLLRARRRGGLSSPPGAPPDPARTAAPP